MMNGEDPLVLVVEDERDLADLYAAWLEDDYRVRTAYGGREALDALEEGPDVVLLDRRMPQLSGDEVLVALRDRGIDCRVAMVTAVQPDFDVVAMGFDDYLVKPVTAEEIREAVSDLLARNDYEETTRELFALASKKALLESEKSAADLEESDEYRELEGRIEDRRGELDGTVDAFADHREFVKVLHDVERGSAAGTDAGPDSTGEG